MIILAHTKNLNLPLSVRSYIDNHCDEFSIVDDRTKLAHIAYRVKRGANLLQDFIDDIELHKETYGNYEDLAKRSIAKYIEILRSNCTEDISIRVLPQKMKFPAIFQLLVEEILYRYVEYDTDGNKVECVFDDALYDYNEIIFRHKELSPTTYKQDFIRYISTTQETLRKIKVNERSVKLKNNWSTLAENLHGNIIWSEKVENELAYPGDAISINTFNAKVENKYRYFLGVPPMPFSGNLLRAKVVILTLNPGYKERINKTMCMAMCDEGKEQIIRHIKNALTLDGTGIYDDSDYSRIQGDFYWEDALSTLAMEAYGKSSTEKGHPIYEDVAFLQLVGYHSVKFKYSAELKHLPSAIFTNLLVKHLATKTDKTFLVLRSETHWREVFGDDLWRQLESDGRIISKGHCGMSQYITKGNLKKDNGFDKLVTILKRQ